MEQDTPRNNTLLTLSALAKANITIPQNTLLQIEDPEDTISEVPYKITHSTCQFDSLHLVPHTKTPYDEVTPFGRSQMSKERNQLNLTQPQQTQTTYEKHIQIERSRI